METLIYMRLDDHELLYEAQLADPFPPIELEVEIERRGLLGRMLEFLESADGSER